MDEPAVKTQRYSCYTCHTHFELPLKKGVDQICPECGETHIIKRCDNDPEGGCHCPLSTKAGIAYCEVCGSAICPTCGDHDVTQISRVTGYLQDVGGFNAAKAQELKDRQRVDPLTMQTVKVPHQKNKGKPPLMRLLSNGHFYIVPE